MLILYVLNFRWSLQIENNQGSIFQPQQQTWPLINGNFINCSHFQIYLNLILRWALTAELL